MSSSRESLIPTTRRRARGFTLIELLVVIAVIMLLAALTMRVVMRATSQARGAQCVNNLSQLAKAFRVYSTTYGTITGTEACNTPTWLMHMDPDRDPGTKTCFPRAPMEGQLFPYYRDPNLVLCPSDRKGNGRFSYSVPVNVRYRVMDQAENPVTALLVIEEHPFYNIGGINPDGTLKPQRREGGFGCSDRVAARHNGRTAATYFDAHAALEDFPPDKCARDFEIKPWGISCGQDWRPR